MDGLYLGSNHICGVVCNILVVKGRLGGRGELGAIAHLVVAIVRDEAYTVVDSLLRILRDRDED